MLKPIKINIYDKINKIKVIIQDFPYFINEYMNFKGFSIKLSALGILYLRIYNTIISKIYINAKIKDGFAKIYQKSKFSIKNAIKCVSKSKERLFAHFTTKEFVNIYNIPNKIKTEQKVTGTIKIGSKNYLDPNGYIIGIPATLGYWDEYYLKDMDNIKMSDISIMENIG